MNEKNVSSDSSQIGQLKKYADDLAKVYNSEKQKRKELESAIRELHETRDMLIQSEKLAAIGRLTAALGHEILNPVNIINMRLQLLEKTEELSDQTKEVLKICKGQLARITELTKDLCQFSRKSEDHLASTDLNNLIEHVLALVAPQTKGDGVEIDVQCDATLPLIQLNKNRVEQVLLNIISNAIFAMAGRDERRLYIRTKTDVSKESVQIEISDTGPGVDKEIINNIFDPFFTTKDVGEGTGLGLYISYNIIKDHGGSLRVENNKWGGASFFIDLPLVNDTKAGITDNK